MRRIIAMVLAVCLAAFIIAGCNGNEERGADKDNITVVFIPKLTGSAFFEAANEGAQTIAEENGFIVEYRGSPEASFSEQIKVINEAIEDGVDAICVSSLDPTALDESLKNARSKGIVVTTWDADVSADARSLMISQGTPEQLGKFLVEMSAESLAERGLNPSVDEIEYVWHYSQATVADQNSWHDAGEQYISETYPNWRNINPSNYYSEQDADKAVSVGNQILAEHQDIDLIICNDSTALPGQAQALQDAGLTQDDITVTGFAPPNIMKQYCKDGIVKRWGLWDCKVQGALACYLSYYLASGHTVSVGDRINVPKIGIVEVMPNTVLDTGAYTAADSGVVLMPSRAEFTAENVDEYNY